MAGKSTTPGKGVRRKREEESETHVDDDAQQHSAKRQKRRSVLVPGRVRKSLSGLYDYNAPTAACPAEFHTAIATDATNEERFRTLINMSAEHALAQLGDDGEIPDVQQIAKKVVDSFCETLDRNNTIAVVAKAKPMKPNPRNAELQKGIDAYTRVKESLVRELDMWKTVVEQHSSAKPAPIPSEELEEAAVSHERPARTKGSEIISSLTKQMSIQVKQLQHTLKTMQAMQEEASRACASHAAAMSVDAFSGYAHVNSPKKLIRGILNPAAL